jgi:hypothetical protein
VGGQGGAKPLTLSGKGGQLGWKEMHQTVVGQWEVTVETLEHREGPGLVGTTSARETWKTGKDASQGGAGLRVSDFLAHRSLCDGWKPQGSRVSLN